MVTKSLLYKYTNQDIDSVDSLPRMSAKDIGQLLVDIELIVLFLHLNKNFIQGKIINLILIQ